MTRVLALALLMVGCGQPKHLQYDFGHSYTTSFRQQADLGRPGVAKAAYPLSGEEGLALRKSVVKETTDEESGEAEAVE